MKTFGIRPYHETLTNFWDRERERERRDDTGSWDRRKLESDEKEGGKLWPIKMSKPHSPTGLENLEREKSRKGIYMEKFEWKRVGFGKFVSSIS